MQFAKSFFLLLITLLRLGRPQLTRWGESSVLTLQQRVKKPVSVAEILCLMRKIGQNTIFIASSKTITVHFSLHLFFFSPQFLQRKKDHQFHMLERLLFKKKTEILCGLRASDLFRYYQDESHINAVAILLLTKLILHK